MDDVKSLIDLCADAITVLEEPRNIEDIFTSIDGQLASLEKGNEENEAKYDKHVQDLSAAAQKCSALNTKLEFASEDLKKVSENIAQKMKSAEECRSLAASKVKACEEILDKQLIAKEEFAEQKQMLMTSYETTLEKLGIKTRIYRIITKLHWSPKADSELCEGYIAYDNDMKPFSLKTADSSQFFIANYLWKLMGQQYD